MILIAENGFKMRKIFNVIFKGRKIEYVRNIDVAKVYRIKKPQVVIILSASINDIQIATLARMMNKDTRIIWISPSKIIEDYVRGYVDIFFGMPFNLDDFVLKIDEIQKI